MFERAEPLVQTETFPLHVLSFYWEDYTPHLEAYRRDRGDVVDMPLDHIRMAVSEERRCVGSYDQGRYAPCPSGRRMKAFAQCRDCMGGWASVQRCVFEPQCTGESCEHRDFCGRRHVVYLAFFGTLVKVGMTSMNRVRQRGIEQGADAIAPVFLCRDRQEARALERETSKRFKIPQEIRIKRIAAQWTHPPSEELIRNLFTSYRGRLAGWREVMDEELVLLNGYPVQELPRSPPEAAPTPGIHAGEVLGVKGRFLIYRLPGGCGRLLDLSDLPSRSIRPLRSDSLQR